MRNSMSFLHFTRFPKNSHVRQSKVPGSASHSVRLDTFCNLTQSHKSNIDLKGKYGVNQSISPVVQGLLENWKFDATLIHRIWYNNRMTNWLLTLMEWATVKLIKKWVSVHHSLRAKSVFGLRWRPSTWWIWMTGVMKWITPDFSFKLTLWLAHTHFMLTTS